MIRSTVFKILALTYLAFLVIACNSGESIKTRAQSPVDTKLGKLLVHFKDNISFPVIIDSAFIAHVTKYDTLVANEVKMLAVQWYKDDMMENDHVVLHDFYMIDSLNAKHGYAKYIDSLQEGAYGDTRFSTAYSLQKIKLTDSTTLLVWALYYANLDTDNVMTAEEQFKGTNIYGTVLNNNGIGFTYLLAESNIHTTESDGNEVLLTDSITNSGKLFFRQTTVQDDYDSMQAQVYQSFYQYQISHGKMSFKSTKDGGNRKEKIKE